MSPAQREALRRAAAATGPVKVPAATARVLGDRYGFLEPEGDGWVLTHRGRAFLAGERAQERHNEVERRLSREDRDWAERVEAWLLAHKRIRRRSYAAWSYARHVAACDHAGVEPVAVGQWADGDREWVEEAVRAAARCLTDFDEAIKTASDRDVGVTVSYGADPKVPRSRREAAEAAAHAGVVHLGVYRERRPTRGGAA